MRLERKNAMRIKGWGANRIVSVVALPRFRQICAAFLCTVLLAQVQIGAGQEPASTPTQVDQSTLTARTAAQNTDTARQDSLPAAPIPQPTLLAEQSESSQQSSSSQQPVGTAAAPYEKPVGVPGSRPAGAAIAPAKQRRVRAIVIRVSLVIAGAGAVGAVVGLSRASHSEP